MSFQLGLPHNLLQVARSPLGNKIDPGFVKKASASRYQQHPGKWLLTQILCFARNFEDSDALVAMAAQGKPSFSWDLLPPSPSYTEG